MKKTLLFLAVFFITLNTFAQCTFGYFPPPFTGSPFGGITNGVWIANKISLTSSANLSGLALEGMSSTGSSFKMALYSDVASSPGTLLAETNTSTVVAGPNILNVTVPVTLAAGDYWIACIYGIGGLNTANTNTGTAYVFPGNVFSSAPVAPAWTPGSISITFNFWAIINTPTLTVSGSSAICQGASTNLSAGGALSYTWSNGSNAGIITVSPTSATNYTLSGTNALGCKTSITKSLSVNPLPLVTIAGSNTVCSFSTLSLTAFGANTYSWTNGFTSATMTDTPIGNTTYGVYGTDTYGCSSFTSIPISVAVSSLAITGPSITCSGAAITLTATGGVTYTWSGAGGTAYTSTITVTPQSNSVYGVTAVEPNGCVRYDNTLVSTMPSPTVNAALSMSTLCVGQTSSITVSGANTYTWNTASNNTFIIVSPTVTTTYTVNGEGSNGCITTTTITQVVDACTGIKKVSYETNLLSVYPNPGNGTFTIRLIHKDENAILKIYDASGKLILVMNELKEEQSMNLNDYPEGLYFLHYMNRNESEFIKLVKQ